ncbi:MAG: hypothetical protein HY423_12350 [Candidatus Lambdaproteobacteria bacterium]|nr:hypothetical protein [Candidatus Lambdaproteobacteria bacterium]
MDRIKLHTNIRPIAEPRPADKPRAKGVNEGQPFAETFQAELNRPQAATPATVPDAVKSLQAEIERANNETAKLLLAAGNLKQRFFQQVKHGLHATATPTDDPDQA